MKKKKTPPKIWAAWANVYGLWYPKPKLCTWDEESQSWWTKDGQSNVEIKWTERG
jgi:hypothetical protein